MPLPIESFSLREVFSLTATAICLYTAAIAFYRLYLSPLAKFPGPKLAAFTFGVEFYYEVVKRGQYGFEISKLHEKYGPIVRITPDEIHINDPDYFEHVFPSAQKPTDKHTETAASFANPMSIISTVSHKLHKLRRTPMNPFFSKRTVAEQASSIQSLVDRLCERLQEFQASQQPANLRVVFSALTADVISLYSYGKSYDYLSKPDFEPGLYQSNASGGELGLLLKQFPWLYKVLESIPVWLLKRLCLPAVDAIDRRSGIESQALAVINAGGKTIASTHESPTVFHNLYNSDIPASERSLARLIDEGLTLIGAGTVTTAHVLSTTSYFILANPRILQSLQEELREDLPDASKPPTSLAGLERLPYLSAVIKEGLRLTHAISHRNTRIAVDHTLQYQGWTIAPGTAVSMTASEMHINPRIYPEPQEFRPERWLQNEVGDIGHLEKYLLPFGKGTRICLGMHLAYAELHLTLAAVFRKFEMKLFETTRRDVDIAHDFIIGAPALDSKSVRVKIIGQRD